MPAPENPLKLAASLICLAASPAAAAGFECSMANVACTTLCETMFVRFEIDETQFVAPQDPNDPPRRQITRVTLDDATFAAQAIMMPGGVRGFHEDAGDIGSRLMIVTSDGAATMTMQPANIILTGHCTQY